MFAHAFVRNAYLAGTFIALACGTVGWFAVLRGQVFAGDALSHVAFVGAIAAAVLGVDERIGLFVLTLAVAGGARAPPATALRSDDTLVGIAFAWVLGIGVLLLAILATSAQGASGVTTANTLFGSIYALSPGGAAAGRRIAAAVTAARAGRRPAAAAGHARARAGRAARRPGPAARRRLSGRAGRGHRREHAGGGSAAAARADRRPGRCAPAR